MARPSPFGITLTAEGQARLEAVARKYASPYRDVIRAKIVLKAARGWPMTGLPADLTVPARS